MGGSSVQWLSSPCSLFVNIYERLNNNIRVPLQGTSTQEESINEAHQRLCAVVTNRWLFVRRQCSILLKFSASSKEAARTIFKVFGTTTGLLNRRPPRLKVDTQTITPPRITARLCEFLPALELRWQMFQAVSDWFGSVSRDEAHETDECPCGGDVEGNVDTRGDEVAGFETLVSTASSFTKRVSESMLESAQSLRKSVQEGKLDHFLDKTIIGEFQKEQDKFTKEKQKNKGEEAVLPWVGYTDEDSIRQQILALSADRRNFLRDPPAGVLCPYDRESAAALGQLLLQEDHVLCEMRFKLVPRLIKEEVFWRNYLYRVSLVKQSADLTSLGQSSLGGWAGPQLSHLDGSRPKTPPKAVAQPSQAVADRATGEENQISMSPSGIEFASDAFPEPSVSQEDLLRGMEQLGMEKTSENEVLPEWERELARELSEFEVVEEGEKGSEAWEQEIEQILQEDS